MVACSTGSAATATAGTMIRRWRCSIATPTRWQLRPTTVSILNFRPSKWAASLRRISGGGG
eukprot:3903965-Prymnesium_polylepis.3